MMSRLALAALVVLAAAALPACTPPVTPETVVRQSHAATFTAHGGEYVAVVLSPGPNWDARRSRDEQAGMTEHRAYMRSLFEQGKILFGGPFVDRPGGLAVYRTESRDEGERLAYGDPGVKNGLLRAEVTRWTIGVGAAR